MITLLRSISRSRSALICLAIMFGGGQVSSAAAQAESYRQHSLQIASVEGVSAPELKKYAKAIIEIEPLRIAALETISKKVDGNLPNLMCHQPDSTNSLPNDARKIFVGYCNQSKSIAQGYGLGMNRFNEITNLVLNNPQLQSRLQRQVACVQGGSC